MEPPFPRIAGIVCGGFYGPYLYLVVTLGGLYLSCKLAGKISKKLFLKQPIQTNFAEQFLRILVGSDR